MYICYLDESGTVEQQGNTGHFVLLGLAVPADTWKAKDAQIDAVKAKYGLDFNELHTAWMLRDYPEQNKVPGFELLDWEARRKAAFGIRALNMAKPRSKKQQRSLLSNYKKTDAYLHLSRAERTNCVTEIATHIGSWTDARIFADAHWKVHTNRTDSFAIAFEQVVTRFNTFLKRQAASLGILVQDNNETVAGRLTTAMKKFHREGTLWASIDKIVETPLFVDSELTSMVQLSDVCAYAVRRFYDNGETHLFNLISPAIDRLNGKIVGIRHFTKRHACSCMVCLDHGRKSHAIKTV